MAQHHLEDTGRRRFLAGSAAVAGAAVTALGAGGLLGSAPARAVETQARILIAGAGAAGLAIANRLSRQLSGAEITLVDSREVHLYQPGLTLVATGNWETEAVQDRNERDVPVGVDWLKDDIVEFNPDNNRAITAAGEALDYDYLIIATGLQLNFDEIEGMDPDLIGRAGVGCVYASPDHAERTWQAASGFIEKGGVGLFTQAPGAFKCAGAPFKITMLIEHALRNQGMRSNAELHYLPPAEELFSQPDVDDFLDDYLPNKRDIAIDYNHALTAIDAERREATFTTPDGPVTLEYDFIHVVPPMSAPDMIRNGDLGWQEGSFQGWLEVDQGTLQHRRYPNVFGAGDVVGTPIGKTAASVKAQAPVVADNVVAAIADKALPAAWNGYTSCPLITERGQAMLVEFDFDLKMTPSFSFIDPMQAQWAPWFLKERMLHPAYNAMLRGRV